MKMMSRSILAKFTHYLVLLFPLHAGYAAADTPLLYRIARTETLVVTDFDGEWISWTNPVLIELQATIDPVWAPWQTLDHIESTATTGSMAVPQPISPIPSHVGLVGISPATVGDLLQEGADHEQPARVIATQPFFIDRYTVTCSIFRDVYQWAYDNERITVESNVVWNVEGTPQPLLRMDDALSTLSFADDTFSVKAGFDSLPITHVSWYGALAFCNYRSAIAGLPEAIDLADWSCDFDAPGFRLPTEIEWERAARGNQSEQRFPWPSSSHDLWNDIDETKANYWADGSSAGSTNTHHLTPVGSFAETPNSLGLFDMAGNVYEWCWDGYRFAGYSDPDASMPGYSGPTGTMTRVVRGGAWCDSADLLRISHRSAAVPQAALPFIGFRCVRRY